MASKFEEAKQFNRSYDELFRKSIEAVNLSGFKLTMADRVSGYIEAKTGISLKSYGENISIQINQNGDVFVRSKCSLPTQLMDLGKNKGNVTRFWKNFFPLLTEKEAPTQTNGSGSFRTASSFSTATTPLPAKTCENQNDPDTSGDLPENPLFRIEKTEVNFQKKQKIEQMKQEIFDQIREVVDEYGGSAKWGTDIEKILKAEILRNFTNSVGMEFVPIPQGDFMMGSNEHDSEKPVHGVKITKSFHLGKYPVTQGQWTKVMGNNNSSIKKDDNPVERVSWIDAQNFIKRLNQMEETGKYRLPSEAEWEYACRAGTTTRYCFGDNESELGEYAWYNENSRRQTHPVGEKKPNPWGLYDMHGNVWEWVQDNWHSNYSDAPLNGCSWEGGRSSFRVHKGGSWSQDSGTCRSAARDGEEPEGCLSSLGFRVLREI